MAEIDGLPKHMILVKLFTNAGIVGYGEVRDASSATYVKMLKSRIVGENPLNINKLFGRIKQFGGHSRQGGGVSAVEVALYDIAGKFYGVPVYQLLGGKYRDKVRVYCDTDVDGSTPAPIWATLSKSVCGRALRSLKWTWASNCCTTSPAR